ncbi:PPE family protein [[Mycobacterium] vasticus]|uniref:PPE family protein n=1 Tax=[Mycobacterium] vasticus TaxID=2875777 RepID=A0ABU5YYN9_9MYCO|nr:PPE family protein [Mycolicibacter sp. MYC017]MEB3070254.1 PPE family protein [Mycolicibacter sp. MYC017]
MDFGALPPEINSGRMYLGPGAGPLLTAAAAWDVLSAELSTAANGYAAVTSELATNSWLGPTSVAMTAAVTPFVAWLHGTATGAAEIAGQARAAATAFELAFAMTVPPPVIAANRSLLAALVATNFFGQNAAAIAAAEAHYAQMWLQDATAMYLYAESSSLASVLPAFHQPPQAADPASSQLQTVLSSPLAQILEHVPNVTNSALSSANAVTSGRGIYTVNMRLAAQEAAEPGTSFPSGARLAAVGAWVSAAWGRAGLVGKLSAPPSWFSAAPELRPTGSTLPGPVLSAAPADPAGCGSVFSQSVLGTLSRDGPPPSRAKSKPIIVRSPAAG